MIRTVVDKVVERMNAESQRLRQAHAAKAQTTALTTLQREATRFQGTPQQFSDQHAMGPMQGPPPPPPPSLSNLALQNLNQGGSQFDRFVRPAYDLARTEIPFADEVARQVDQQGPFAAGQYIRGQALGAVGLGGLNAKLPTIGEAIVPQEVWEVGAELTPLGTAGDFRRGLKEAPTLARTGLRNLDELAQTRFPRGLADETGSVPMPFGRAGNDLPPFESPTRLMEGAGDALVPAGVSPAPTTGDVMPPVIQRVIDDLGNASLSTKARKTIIKAGRQRQAAGLGEALDQEGSVIDRALAGRGAEKGRIVPGIRPIGDQYTAQEIDEVYGAVDQAYRSDAITKFEYPNAVSALELLFKGQRLPTVSDASKPLHLMPHEIKLLGRVFGPAFEKALPRSRADLTLFQRAVDIANVPRSLQTMLDLSASLRQGGMLAVRNPAEWKRAFGKQVTAMGSEANYNATMDAIRQMDSFVSGQQHGLRIVGMAGDPNAEEAFLSTAAENIPGVGKLVKGSERGYTTFLNYMRQSVYDKNFKKLTQMAERHAWEPERLDDALEQMATFINHATGQGDVGMLREYVPAMNALFFSPKYVISRPQAIWDLVKPGVDPQVRRMVAENLATFFGAGTAILAAAKMSGVADVELDPRSSDFGKVRVGDTRFDFWSGYQPLVRYAAQIASGDRKELFTGDIMPSNRGTTLGRFFRSKLSPVGALGWDVVVEGGRDYQGAEFGFSKPGSIAERAIRSVTPLFVQNLYDALQEGGVTSAAMTAAPAALGVGTGTYGPSEQQEEQMVKGGVADRLREAGLPDRNQTFSENESFRAAWADAFGVASDDMPSDFGEFRKQMIERAVEGGMSASEAAARFDSHPFTNQIERRLSDARIAFWQQHPDLLQEAINSGVEDWSQAKGEILAGR